VSVRAKRTIWPLVDTRGLTAIGSHVLHAARLILATEYKDEFNSLVSEGRRCRADPSLTRRVSFQSNATPGLNASGSVWRCIHSMSWA